MRTLFKFLFVLLLVSVVGCGTSSIPKASPEQLAELENLVENKKIFFEAEWAMPLTTNSLNQISNAGLLPPGSTANQINLIGNNNFLKIDGDSVSAYLPYYGERQMGGGYGQTNTGIKFEGGPTDFEISKDDKKNTYSIKFDVNDRSEAFQVNMTLFPNMTASVNINSNERFSIRYQGTVKEPLQQ
ncbi:MAG: hypothetical protein CMH48_03935 [Muricauda sp.]|nr:DUF4251 domain-containing protein [Allomuricauda sp.]MBC29975.1 hypothetical protein [Allomuricauda sp.]|tara:strand:+ start:100435 stop:100992 length:558 start_codon:yes stop_codon:yes gene_type:complete